MIRDPRRRRGVLRFLDHAPGFGLRGHRRQLRGAQGAELREIPGQIAQLFAAALEQDRVQITKRGDAPGNRLPSIRKKRRTPHIRKRYSGGPTIDAGIG